MGALSRVVADLLVLERVEALGGSGHGAASDGPGLFATGDRVADTVRLQLERRMVAILIELDLNGCGAPVLLHDMGELVPDQEVRLRAAELARGEVNVPSLRDRASSHAFGNTVLVNAYCRGVNPDTLRDVAAASIRPST